MKKREGGILLYIFFGEKRSKSGLMTGGLDSLDSRNKQKNMKQVKCLGMQMLS